MNQRIHSTLLLSSRNTEDNQSLWRAAVRRGWSVERLRGRNMPSIAGGKVVIYIESLFAPMVANYFGIKLAQTSDSWLPDLPEEYRRREVRLTTLGLAFDCSFPLFVKPPNDKLFPAQVYDDATSLPKDYDREIRVLVAPPVEWSVEFRCFCLDGHVRTLSPYLRDGQLSSLTGFAATKDEIRQTTEFAERVLADARVCVPRAIVLDVGIIVDRGWAVVEANGAWGSGIYGCDPDEILNVIEHAVERCNGAFN